METKLEKQYFDDLKRMALNKSVGFLWGQIGPNRKIR